MRKGLLTLAIACLAFVIGSISSQLGASSGANFSVTVSAMKDFVKFTCEKGCTWREQIFACSPGEESCLFRATNTAVKTVDADSPTPK